MSSCLFVCIYMHGTHTVKTGAHVCARHRWEKDQGVKRGSSGQFFYKGKPSMVTFMADTRSELTQALDMVLD
eukprot:COSAG02_NODE_56653_length_284_cov_1.108108_2_plen_71_part_01